jgi:hypothetical protein
MLILKSIGLFVLAALAEIGGAWLVWQGVREHKGWAWIGACVIALGLYGFVATLQPDASSPRTAGCSSPGPWPGAWVAEASVPTAGTLPAHSSASSAWPSSCTHREPAASDRC